MLPKTLLEDSFAPGPLKPWSKIWNHGSQRSLSPRKLKVEEGKVPGHSMTTLLPGADQGSDWTFERRSEPNGTLPHQW